MLPWSGELSGRAVELTIDSDVLRDNPLSDPWQRPLLVQLPPSYDENEDIRYPVVYWLQGFMGHGGMWRNRSPFRQPFFELADQVLADPVVPPFCWSMSTPGLGTAAASSSTPRAPVATTPTCATK